jgi:hypothetical protein
LVLMLHWLQYTCCSCGLAITNDGSAATDGSAADDRAADFAVLLGLKVQAKTAAIEANRGVEGQRPAETTKWYQYLRHGLGYALQNTERR